MTDPDTDQLRDIIGARTDEFDAPGDAWLFRPNPDEASLMVDALTDAVRAYFEQRDTERFTELADALDNCRNAAQGIGRDAAYDVLAETARRLVASLSEGENECTQSSSA